MIARGLLGVLGIAMVGLGCATLPGCIVVAVNRPAAYSSPSPRIGVSIAEVPESTASQLGVDCGRVSMITEVYGGSPADRAGLRQFDVITKIEGRDSADQDELRSSIRTRKPGETLTLDILRGGKPMQICVAPEPR